jgi:hypothetical protein
MARTHLQMSNPELTTRTWRQVMDAVVQTKRGPTKIRYERAVVDQAFDDIPKFAQQYHGVISERDRRLEEKITKRGFSRLSA